MIQENNKRLRPLCRVLGDQSLERGQMIMGETAVLAELWRGGFKESAHYGHVAAVDEKGELVAFAGDPNAFVYPRSALKPIQALCLVESGAASAFGFTQRELALCAASHQAEDFHVETVKTMLGKAGLDVSYLQCGAHAPYSPEAAAALARAGREPEAVHSNCSGKHTGMLTAAKHMGADLHTYLEPDHPVQRYILQALCDIIELPESQVPVAVDGCGAPVFGIPLAKLALIFAYLAAPDKAPEAHRVGLRTVRDAMMAYPEMVAGTGRFCTRLMQEGNGQIVSKAGAEGVYGVGLLASPLGVKGVAVKVQDGAGRAAEPAVMKTLVALGALDQSQRVALSHFSQPEVRNVAGKLVGDIRSTFDLTFVK